MHDFLKKDDEPITIGTLSLEKGQEIKVGIESLFASHVGIFGNTGSGKSYTLAKIYRELFKQYKDQEKFKKNSLFFLIDFNGEYIGDNVIIEKSCKNIYKLSTDENGSENKFPITKNAIQVSDKGITYKTVLMDSWYATTLIMLLIDSKDKIYYCPIKSNRNVDNTVSYLPTDGKLSSFTEKQNKLQELKIVSAEQVEVN